MILHQPSRAAADETDVDILLRNKELVVDMELDPAWPRMDHIRTLQVRHAELGMVVCATQSAPQGTWDVRMDTNFGTDVWKEQRLVAIMQGVLTPAVPLTQALVLDSSYDSMSSRVGPVVVAALANRCTRCALAAACLARGCVHALKVQSRPLTEAFSPVFTQGPC
jgi:hypothetical protein